MTQHEQTPGVRVVPQYNVDTLGAPFKVTLANSATVKIDRETGEEIVTIPDVVGLISAVVRCRALHPRKLGGEEIKFIRKSLGVKAKSIADFLDMTPEHLSRCEAGARVMSALSEKHLRLFAFFATFIDDPEEVLSKFDDISDLEMKEAKPEPVMERFVRLFFSMKIQTVFDPTDELHFNLTRRAKDHKIYLPSSAISDDCEWSPDTPLAA
ncbi:hypothetical protein [Methylobacterium organophilum]|uniref:hypothetical protein n=1 Tax=Methylobacterium organophilum TaxID=410 RepID=UPI001EE1A318|nr:hypothetical protein [Methylobacterium organophilum]